MAIDRNNLVSNVNPFPWLIHISRINQMLREFHQAFSAAFAEGGEEHPQENALHHVTVFNEIWNQLDKQSANANSLDDLYQIYFPIDQNLERYIEEYCRDFSLKMDIFTADKRKMLEQIVCLHYALVRQRFLLLPFEEKDTNEKLLAAIHKINDDIRLFEKEHAPILLRELTKSISSFRYLVCDLIRTLRYKGGYGPLEMDLDMPNFYDVDDLHEIRKYLTELPHCQEANLQIDRLQTAVKESNKKNIAICKSALMSYVHAIEKVKMNTRSFISKKFHLLNGDLERYLEYCETQEIKLKSFDKRRRKVANAIIRVLTMDGKMHKESHVALEEVGRRVVEACEMQNHTEWFALNFKASAWHLAAKKINISLSELAKDLKLFVSQYATSLNEIQLLKNRIEQHEQNLQDMHLQRTIVASQLAKAVQTWEMGYKAFSHFQLALLTHCNVIPESTIQFINTFLSQHWGKISIGGSGGGSLSTLLSILISGVHPIPLVISGILGVLFGGSAGALTGVCMDHYSPQSKDDTSEVVEVPLLDEKALLMLDDKVDDQHRSLQELAASNSPPQLPDSEETQINYSAPASPSSPLLGLPRLPRWNYGSLWQSALSIVDNNRITSAIHKIRH